MSKAQPKPILNASLPAQFRQIRIVLAREPGHPDGDDEIAYIFVAPVDAEGRIASKLWRGHREACRVSRQRPNEQASPDEDDNRKRYLEDYQGAASMKAPRRLRGCIRNQRCIFLKSRRQIQASGAECRGETEEYPGEK